MLGGSTLLHQQKTTRKRESTITSLSRRCFLRYDDRSAGAFLVLILVVQSTLLHDSHRFDLGHDHASPTPPKGRDHFALDETTGIPLLVLFENEKTRSESEVDGKLGAGFRSNPMHERGCLTGRTPRWCALVTSMPISSVFTGILF
jgi:hypothetical protein